MSVVQLKPGYEEVFTVTDYYDGPRQGIANFKGKPHFYDCIFDEARQDYSDRYRRRENDYTVPPSPPSGQGAARGDTGRSGFGPEDAR